MKKLALLIVALLFFVSPLCFANEYNANEDDVKRLSQAVKNIKNKELQKANGPPQYLTQYLSLIHRKITNNWKLQETEKFDNNLETIVVIKIQHTGNIEQIHFEKKSGNNEFNNIVVQSALNSNPLPPLPPEINKDTFEVGLRFKPGELY